jgi:cytochrome c biogenesis protein CcdA
MNEKLKKGLILGITIITLAILYFIFQSINPETIKNLGLSLPLPLFTLLIAIIDGFNPCNLFILTLLLSLMLAESHSKKRILIVGFTFILIIYLFYFLFMSLWLNLFQYIGFINPLKYTIAAIAIIAGLINIKELLFYRKGITLMVQDKQVGPLKKRISRVAHLIKKGSLPTLIGSSILLAIFSSLVELPCTAGFPIIYTGILTGTILKSGITYYLYLLLYNLIYVLPLIVIISVLGYFFNGKAIKPTTMSFIKFIGGAIMLLLGIILLVNPAIIGL